jgi:hypothetical protein
MQFLLECLEWLPYLLPLMGIAWAPRTWIAGELVTASNMNTHVRDHLNAIRARETTTSTGTQNDYSVDGAFVYLVCNNASALTITGIVLNGGNIDGARLYIEAINSGVTFKHQDTGSAAANRIIAGTGADVSIVAGDRVLLFYDDTDDRWRLGLVSVASAGGGDIGWADVMTIMGA